MSSTDKPRDDSAFIRALIAQMVEAGAADLLLTPGARPTFRVDQELRPLPDAVAFSSDDFAHALRSLAPAERWTELRRGGRTEFTVSVSDEHRLRVTAAVALDGLTVAMRLIRAEPLPLEEAGLPEPLLDALLQPHGLMIVTGPAGSGRTTLLASFVDAFNRLRNLRILCLEDSVEVVHANKNSIVSQRRLVGTSAERRELLEQAIAEGPDLLVVNDLDRPELVEPLLELAASGTLVLAGMPYRCSSHALAALVEGLSDDRRRRALTILSEHLHWSLAQALLRPSRGRGLIPAREILLRDEVTRAILAKGDFGQLAAVMHASGRPGVVELNQALIRLVQSNDVKSLEAYRATADRNRLAREFRRSGIELTGLSHLEKSILEHASAPKPTRESVQTAAGRAASGTQTRSGSLRRGWF